MTEQKIIKENAEAAYMMADGPFKKILGILLGKKTGPLRERINSFAAVCEEAGVDEADYEFPSDGSAWEMLGVTTKRNMLIARVFNAGRKLKPGQRMYYPYFNMIVDEKAPRGFRLSFFGYYCVDDYANLGARPLYVESDDAVFVGNEFTNEAEDFVYWNLQVLNQ